MKYKNFEIIQKENNDVEIREKGKLIFHGQYTRELTEFELYKVVDDYLNMLSEEPTVLDEALAQYLMAQGVITEPAKLGQELYYIERFDNSNCTVIKKGMYVACSKNHVILTWQSLNKKPFEEQLEDLYRNKRVLLVIVKNEDVFYSEEEARKELGIND